MAGRKTGNKGTTPKTTVTKTASEDLTVQEVRGVKPTMKLTDKEKQVRALKKYATTSFGFGSKVSSMYGNTMLSNEGNFYSPQLSTDFLEKPQNLRERRAWYRHFYNSNEFVGSAIDLHSTLPLSKVKLEKPKCKNPKMAQYVYTFFEDMCQDMRLFKVLTEISHEYWLMGNCLGKNSKLRCVDSYKKAVDVSVGDYVLTHEGRFRRVKNKFSRYSEKITNIEMWKTYKKLDLTEEHPVEVYRNGKFEFIEVKDLTEDDYIRVTWVKDIDDVKTINYLESFKNLDITESGYTKETNIKRKRAKKSHECRLKMLFWLSNLTEPVIKSRDDIAFDLNVERKTLDNVLTQLNKEFGKSRYSRRIGASNYQKGSRVEWLPFKYSDVDSCYEIKRIENFTTPHTVDIDEDFCYLLGYWIGDGTISRDNSRKNIWGRAIWNIVFGDSSDKQKEKIYRILQEKIGIQCIKEWDSYRDCGDGKVSKLSTVKIKSNPAFVEWWANNFGETTKGDNRKKIPLWVSKLPLNKLYALIAGLVDSDGCISNGVCDISLSSESLISSIQEILLKCNIVPNINKKEGTKGTGVLNNNGKIYSDVYKVVFKARDFSSFVGNYSIKGAKYSDIKQEKPYLSKYIITDNGDIAFKVKKITESEYNDMVFNFEVEEDHTFQVEGFSTHNCFPFAEDHDPYDGDEQTVAHLKEEGRQRAEYLWENFKVRDKDPNYKGWRKIIILPPDQVRVRNVLLSDQESIIEFMPDPETKKLIMGEGLGRVYGYSESMQISEMEKNISVPEKMRDQIREGGSIPLDTDPYTGSHVYHLARKKSQYETLGVSILERCINTLLFADKIRQAQTSIASRHMTPIRIVWAEELNEADVEALREQVDLALVDPDYSIITNYQVNWEEMGSNGRLLELSTEYEHIENSLFAGLNVTREILTGEGSYSGSRITLEVMNRIYLLFRDSIQEYIENYLFKPVAHKKGFVEKDEFGRERLIYPKLSFTRLAIKDNDVYFDQVNQLYQKGSVSVDVILDMLGIDPDATKEKIEADLFTVNDASFNAFMQSLYTAVGSDFFQKYDVEGALAKYLRIPELVQPAGEEEGGLGGAGLGGGLGGGEARFASEDTSDMTERRKAALQKLMKIAIKNPDKLDKLAQIFDRKRI